VQPVSYDAEGTAVNRVQGERVVSEASNKGLHGARAAKKDEFYTQLPDIERELRH